MNITPPSKPVLVKQEELFPDILDKTKEKAELRTMGIAILKEGNGRCKDTFH
uniref:Uncharacterized protein n=1 Tax=Moniliophthora roreri TaxID=221103 RepID=A0A0W0FKV3_MONRR